MRSTSPYLLHVAGLRMAINSEVENTDIGKICTEYYLEVTTRDRRGSNEGKFRLLMAIHI